MSDHPTALDLDLDIVAYVDGLLEGDPALKATTEAKLAASPDLAERVRAYRDQNAALRRELGWRAGEPVPERLVAVLDRPPLRRGRTAAMIAAMVLFGIAAGASGWLVGRGDGGGEWSRGSFVESSYRAFVEGDNAPSVELARAGEPLAWLSEEVFLSIRAPNLESLGYSIVAKETVADDGHQVVKLVYATPGGRSFSLILRPRWNERRRDLQVETKGDVSLAYWLEGPLASAVASRLPAEETLRIAKTVRGELTNPAVARPVIAPAGPADGGTEAGRANSVWVAEQATSRTGRRPVTVPSIGRTIPN